MKQNILDGSQFSLELIKHLAKSRAERLPAEYAEPAVLLKGIGDKHRDVLSVLKGQDNLAHSPDGPNIIAEIKFASPSKGWISDHNLTSVDVATSYVKNGAKMLSILTEPDFFAGDIRYIEEVRDRFPNVPILTKDFIVDIRQIGGAIAAGASTILLIVALLTDDELATLYNYAVTGGLTPLVEVHSEEEMRRVFDTIAGVKLMGFNNRNLKTLEVDPMAMSRLASSDIIPSDSQIVCVCESGITNGKEVYSLEEKGYDAFLIGSHFMSCKDPGEPLRELLKEYKAG